MASASEIALEPFFLNGPRGRVFCVFVAPEAAASRGTVLFVPPFAEEMNKSRRQLMIQARAFAAAGYGSLLVDLFGTGDSEGDFAEARWETWVGDLTTAVRWLGARGHERVAVCALRFGALLAADLVREVGAQIERLVFWQPVSNGRQHTEQFLRLRVAAAMVGGKPAVTTRDLREMLAGGETVEVAGYGLNPELIAAIDARDLQNGAPTAGLPVRWLELVQEPGRGLGAASQRVIAAWRERGTTIEAEDVVGPQFWSTVEITVAPALVERSTGWIAERR